jgi:hypothetical protein
MTKSRRSEKITRPLRATHAAGEKDEQTQLELEMAASGRRDAVPREGLVGAHAARREGPPGDADEGADTEASEEGDEPSGQGADVAPTKRAEERERERHRLERELGRTPAGEEGLVHDRRAPGVSREGLDEAAREADRRVAGHDVPKRSR